jgi:hypothetical protein
MRLVVAVAYLDRREWSADTVWASVRFAFELLVRGLAGDRGRDLAAHVALRFEDVTDTAMLARVAKYVPAHDHSPNFFVDILSNGNHGVSHWDDDSTWWGKWSNIRAEMYTVRNVDEYGIRRAFDYIMDLVEARAPYDSCVNLNSVLLWPCRCRPYGCFGGSGVTCVYAVLTALAAARDAYDPNVERVLGIPRRVALAARLPRVMIKELLRARVLYDVPHIVGRGDSNVAQMPLLTI